MSSFNTFEAFSAAQASGIRTLLLLFLSRRDKGPQFCFIRKGIWYFLCLSLAQPFPLHNRAPQSGKQWETLPGDHNHNNVLNFAVEK
jgi:hypothetical protein